MPVVAINNTSVHYQQLNETGKETVILIHGMFSNLAVYYFNIAPLLAQRYRVVMYDMKGHGMSSRVTAGYDLQAMADDLLALMKALDITSAHLVGYSFGGLVALKMAMLYPQCIQKLGVIEGPDPADKEALKVIETYSKDFLVHYVNTFTDNAIMKMGKRQLEKNHRMYEFLFNETTIRADMQAEHAFFTAGGVDAIGHTTLLLYGRQSNCVAAGEKLHQMIKHASMLLIEGDHNVPLQQPLVIGNALTAFFDN
ncbi:Pimeloyl-ACP methyl ester carboxylesterase [Filimonas lacunae]|uniref:Pimeloyl-ACP methyl ester carboxylesterase n=1 Tax=Filimonas lacunae TaxID=477680 RepID=A0A173M9A5_9BACT|nr:alpha/beta hydrolase [Filimonas lacunae]BAV04113.1 alpha/beta hydrolase fold [Filimonas lacunae]SIT15330.1 Pimeloyl-ACP methyl ester carboxylesterase [Filimonas lacunae]